MLCISRDPTRGVSRGAAGLPVGLHKAGGTCNEMSVKALCVEPHPVLREKARPIERFGVDLKRLAQDMIETMYAHDGIGLAAPQIGKDVQVFVANPSQQRGSELVVVNPTITKSRGRTGITEGCLSLPDVWEKIRRAARIDMSGQNLNGKPITIEAQGILAIVLQHEFDHLQGRLFIDRLPWFRRRWLKAKESSVKSQRVLSSV